MTSPLEKQSKKLFRKIIQTTRSIDYLECGHTVNGTKDYKQKRHCQKCIDGVPKDFNNEIY
jgi:hypothetical protein